MASVQLQIGTLGNPTFFQSTINSGIGGVGFVGDALLNFTFGISFQLLGKLDVRASQIASLSGGGFAQSLFLNTAGWGGILEVLDQNGNVVPDFAIESSSGTNWRVSQRPVPLPATWFLFVTGCLGLLLAHASARADLAHCRTSRRSHIFTVVPARMLGREFGREHDSY